MIGIDPASLAPRECYRLVIGTVVPRPIAWITTRNDAGVVNLAPFSFFNGVCASPFIVSVSIAHRDPIKDTLRNLRANAESVVHLVPPALLAQAHASGSEYAAEVSEVDHLGLPLVPSQRIAVPRLADAEIALECRLQREIPVGSPAVSLCLLEVVWVHIAEHVATDGMPDPLKLRAPARLGGNAYVSGDTWTVLQMPRVPPPDHLRLRT